MYLNFLENCDISSVKHSCAPSPLQAAVEAKRFELLMHPIVQRLIDVKWKLLGRAGAWLDILPNLLLTILYTVIGVIYPTDVTNYYQLATNWWRLSLEFVVMALTANEIRKEVKEYYRSKRQYTKWKQWRTRGMQRDLEFCHPRWVQEKAFVEREIRMTRERKKTYFQDVWNYFDWLAYVMLIVVFIMHYINISLNNNIYNDVVIKIMACTLILIWVRMLKFARPFPTQGPFVVMLDHIMVDTAKWSFLLAMIYIPFAAAFWMVFGGRTANPIKGYDTIPNLIFTMIRFPLVDDYNFVKLEQRAPIMSRVLCGAILVLGAIILMNMYIALLSNTFQRVYDNAKATAVMQRARWIQDIEASSSRAKIAKYREFIRANCSPEQKDYLVIITDVEEHNRKQEEKISELHFIVNKRLATSGKTAGKSDFDTVIEDVTQLKVSQTEIKHSLALLGTTLAEVTRTNAFILKELKELQKCHDEVRQPRECLHFNNEVKEIAIPPPERLKLVEEKAVRSHPRVQKTPQKGRKKHKEHQESSSEVLDQVDDRADQEKTDDSTRKNQHSKEAYFTRLKNIYGVPDAAKSSRSLRKEDGYSTDDSTLLHSV